MSLEDQLQILDEGGLRLRAGIPIDVLFERSTREATDKEDGYQPISNDIFVIDAECIGSDGDYRCIFERFRDITHGSLPITDIEDSVYLDIPEDKTIGKVWVAFVHNGKRH